MHYKNLYHQIRINLQHSNGVSFLIFKYVFKSSEIRTAALERLKIEYELVGFSEIDKYAIKSYCAIHNVSEDKNYGDISKINENNLPDFDIMTWRVSMSGY